MADSYLFALVFGAFLAGGFLERLLRFFWVKPKNKTKKNTAVVYQTPQSPPVKNYGYQLRVVMEADFEKRPLMSKSEARLFYEAENTIKTARLNWRVIDLPLRISSGEN